jgi:anhydro-N-acetylmuramic acid kinase
MNTYKVIGVMTGTSMDGLDIAYCILNENNGKWSYKIEVAECVPFPQKWKLRLQSLVLQNAVTYLKTDSFFGHYIGEEVRRFIEANELQDKVDFICSHGQTVFHQPENQMTSQIGDGAAIAAETGFPVICDFRTSDVALGGQATPVTPIADIIFFPEYKFCLNLGGIANISCKLDNKVIGFDVCGVNMVLNFLAGEFDLEYDKDGGIARTGQINQELLFDMNSQWYYEKLYPKSLGGGYVTKVFMPLLKKYRISIEDRLRTAVEHIAMQIGKDVNTVINNEGLDKEASYQMLVTGGGAFNKFLIERIKSYSPVEVIVPDAQTIKFKEALMVALLGCLRLRGEVNVLSSVTGAREDSIGGAVFNSMHHPIHIG